MEMADQLVYTSKSPRRPADAQSGASPQARGVYRETGLSTGPSTAFFDDEVLSGLDALAGLEGCSEIFTLAEDLGLHHAL